MKSRAARIARFILRWTIATLGIIWVLTNLHLYDRALVLDDNQLPVERKLLEPANEQSDSFVIASDTGPLSVQRDRVINGPDRKTIILDPASPAVKLLGMRLAGDLDKSPRVLELLITDSNGRGRWIRPDEVVDGFVLDVPQPRVQEGILTMLHRANPWLLVGSFSVIIVTFICTTIRWKSLLHALGVNLTLSQTFVLNMVGAFYNTFMPGSTGGDVLKAYYAAKQAPEQRTAVVMSVIIDRVLGLLTLIMLGGSMAAIQFALSPDPTDPVARMCRRVALFAALLLSITVVGLWAIYTPWLRRRLGISRLLSEGKVGDKLRKILDVMQIYRQRPGLIFRAILITVPVHVSVIVSAMLAGEAFGLPISPGYYFIVVPVVVLSGAIPISPQGVGVMEAFAFYLTKQEGATLNQALALTMSIRLVSIFWNLLGGIFVLRGGFHAPKEVDVAGENIDTDKVATESLRAQS